MKNIHEKDKHITRIFTLDEFKILVPRQIVALYDNVFVQVIIKNKIITAIKFSSPIKIDIIIIKCKIPLNKKHPTIFHSLNGIIIKSFNSIKLTFINNTFLAIALNENIPLFDISESDFNIQNTIEKISIFDLPKLYKNI